MSILSDVNIGNLVVVSENNAKNPLKERLLSLGITNGAYIEVLRKGPKNNLTVYRIRGAMIALRSEEASLINVSLVI
ncbi:FeoA family protein [Clostridium frigidicarnis]|uniref:Ferrous iron transport protein A n=1 Tax=Clostridium frigidicarnis TaxID=84698 RepID=A0A1I0X3A1_9CLOT|nr:FeoA family protein [Clostridium frigidicarnis]SFA94836.1 ferrous iron transport protein A [Clostridium frigidicarnis]